MRSPGPETQSQATRTMAVVQFGSDEFYPGSQKLHVLLAWQDVQVFGDLE